MKLFLLLPIVYSFLIPQQFLNFDLQIANIEEKFSNVFNKDDLQPDLSPSLEFGLVDKSNFTNWINDQFNYNWAYLLRNIGNSTYNNDKEISPGVIIASPSKIKPNYYYQWTRDSALTIRTLIHFLQDDQQDHEEQQQVKNEKSKGSGFKVKLDKEEIQLLVEQYIWNNYNLQRLSTLSGDFNNGGIGEPKYHVNNSAFMETWGRPQNDGPGLRITSIINFMNLNLSSLTNLNNTFIYNEILKPDLKFILNNWEKNSFDLWEEINSLHFFTSIVQLKGLFDGLNFIIENNLETVDLNFLDELKINYENLKNFIENYYINSKVNYVIESPKLKNLNQRNGLDSAVLLGSIHSHDLISNDLDNKIPFNINNNYILNHLLNMVNDMKLRYPVNYKYNDLSLGVGIGRYPEDIYDGYGTSEGNPWFISTATSSELIYKLIFKLINDKQDIIITSLNKDFYKKFLNSVVDEDDFLIIKYNSKIFKSLILNLFKFSDSFLDIIKNHVDLHGGILEQFNKYHGFMQGAKDLTWSYSSLLNAFRWRLKIEKVLSDY